MSKYLLLTVGLASEPRPADPQTQAYNARWAEWIRSLFHGGILESGLPLEATGKTVTRDAVTEYELQREDVYGYMVINADSLDAAIEVARQSPHMELGGKTIIRPCADPNM